LIFDVEYGRAIAWCRGAFCETRTAVVWKRIKNILLVSNAVALSAFAGSCAAVDRLTTIGEKPSLSSIDNPTAQPGYQPVQMPTPPLQPATYNPNSLWRTGSQTFFKDQRAAQVGDILTVTIKITDKANLTNETKRRRANNENAGIGNLLGTDPKGGRASRPEPLLTAKSAASSDGKGSVVRREALHTNIAAVITQSLPNGNLVIEGRQEMRINNEIRELLIAGIVRPEDIQSDNTIDWTKIAEARIGYGGRGQITDVQQPRYGQQALDVLLPF
jgi:flagellar L-ring protein precursor FlgH